MSLCDVAFHFDISLSAHVIACLLSSDLVWVLQVQTPKFEQRFNMLDADKSGYLDHVIPHSVNTDQC